MRHVLQSLIISFVVVATALPSFAGNDREDRNWSRDKKGTLDKEDSHKGHHGKRFAEILDAIRGVTQNWDKKLDSTNGKANGCNSDRFTCVLDGAAVRDNETGLVWERSPVDDGVRTWSQAVDDCVRRKVSNRYGWHLPTIEQLTSLLDPSVMSGLSLPAGHPFQNVLDQLAYWSTTTHPGDPLLAYLINHVQSVGALVNTGFKVGTGNNRLVWCVRGGQSFDQQDLLDTQ